MSDTEFNAAAMAEDAGQPLRAQTVERPGVQLTRQRELMGWSIEQVAEQLKLAPRQVLALEADDYAALPALAVVRGFIRAYAKILKIDASPLVSMIQVETEAPKEPMPLRSDLSSKFLHSTAPLMSKRGFPIGWTVLGLVAVLALVSGAQRMGWLPSTSSLLKASASASASAPAASAVALADNVAVINTAPVAAPTVDAAAVTAPAPADDRDLKGAPQTTVTPAVPTTTTAKAAPAAVAVTAAPVAAPAPAPTPTTSTAPALAAGDALVLTIHEDSWIAIKRANGTMAISRVLKAGSTESVMLDGPAQLVVGNVAGVEATWRGAPLKIKSVSGGNTARLNLK